MARVGGDVQLAGGRVSRQRCRQAGNGRARNRARARLNWVSQGQRWGRCKGKMQGEAARRGGEPSGDREEPPPQGLGDYDLRTQTEPRGPAGHVMRHHLDGQPGSVGGEAARGEMIQPHAVLEVSDGILDLGVAAMVGFQCQGLPVPVGDESRDSCKWRRGPTGNRDWVSPGGRRGAQAWRRVLYGRECIGSAPRRRPCPSWWTGPAESIVSPAFDAATQPQSTSVLLANGHGLEDARWRRVIDATGSPARYVAAVPQRTRKSLAAVYGLQVAVRRAVRTASPRLVGFLRPFVRPAPVGAVGLGLASLEVSPHDATPASDLPVGPEPAGMVAPGVDDLERAVRRRRLAEKISVEPQVAAPADDRLVSADSAGMETTHTDGGVFSLRRGQCVREGGAPGPSTPRCCHSSLRRKTGTPRSPR